MELIYGTTNPAKLNLMKGFLFGTGIRVIGLNELPELPGEPGEYGRTPLENARGKAEYYYRILKRPVFSCDSGLFIDGLSEEEQPGVHVRRRNGKVLTDPEMTEYYASIASRFGGKCRARYQNGICVIFSETERYEHDGEEISGEGFWLVDQAKPQKEKGFPLDCISVDMETGLYFVDEGYIPGIGEEEKGLRGFWQLVMDAHEKKRRETERNANKYDKKVVL